MRIRWTPAAAADLQHISEYLAVHHPHYRQPTLHTLYDSVRSLKLLPNRGRPGREKGTRELILSPLPYVIAYRVEKQSIQVLHIHHQAQDR